MKEISYAPGYCITEDGEVWSFKDAKREGRKLRPSTTKQGYRQVTLFVGNRPVYRKVATLVAEAFLERPAGTYLVRHLDDNPSNDHVANLRWGTQADNAADRLANRRQTGQSGEAHHKARLCAEDIPAIRKRYDMLERPATIARDYPVSASMISQIGRRVAWRTIPE